MLEQGLEGWLVKSLQPEIFRSLAFFLARVETNLKITDRLCFAPNNDDRQFVLAQVIRQDNG